MRLFHTIAILIFALPVALGQTTLRGTVTDATSGEVLIGATLYEPSTGRGHTTSSYGHFAIPGVTDSTTLTVSYMGYVPQTLRLAPSAGPIAIRLQPGATELEGVVVRGVGSRTRDHGQLTISAMDLRSTPVLMAERDVLKTLQLLPGVQRNSEGTSNFSVRGGSHDQNLMLIDGIPVYNINHLWGFVSVFNADAVNSVSFYKGGIPASYGGRLSSVVDVRLREGNSERYTGSVSLGLISSRFTFEGPIQKGRSSFLVAGRRTLYDLIVAPTAYLLHGYMPGYYFQDYTLKLNHRVNPHNSIFLSTYAGNDEVYLIESDTDGETGIEYKSQFERGWGNITSAFRWNNTSIPNIFSNVTLAYTHFRYFTTMENTHTPPDDSPPTVYYQGYHSGVNNAIGGWRLTYHGFRNHVLSAGLDATWHMFNPGITNHYQDEEGVRNEDFTLNQGVRIYGQEYSAYLDNRFELGRLSGNVGVRHTLFRVVGRTYQGLQPRANLELGLSESTSLMAGYNRMFQYLHLVSNSNLGMPTDLWLPITRQIPPQRADQVSLGVRQRLWAGLQLTVEAYTKRMANLTEYRDGVVLRNQATDWERVLAVGEGSSRGVELMLESTRGRITGWLTYSLSRTDRTFSEIRTGRPFPFRYDRRHVANLFVSYQMGPQRSLSAAWVASSGHWMTVNHDSYLVNGQVVYNLTDRNNFRVWPNHRLDVSYTSSKERRRGTRSWIIGIYNAYANHNTFMIMRQGDDIFGDDFRPIRYHSVSLFPLIPYVAWEFRFK